MRDAAVMLVKCLQNAGYEAFLVGGCVRDEIMGLTPHDYDIVTSAHPEQIEALFADYQTIPVGKAFGVIVVVVDGTQYQIATYRADGAYSDSRHPDEVRFVKTIDEDLARRDFRMNAIAYDPISDKYIDPFNGRRDIECGRVIFVGKMEERINEDPLRILRLIKFAKRYEFSFHWGEFGLGGFAYYLRRISRERISQEFQEILLYKNALLALRLAEVLPFIIPGIESTWSVAGVQDSYYHKEGDVWTHTKMVVDVLRDHGADFKLLLAGLLHDIGKPATHKCFGNGRVSCKDHATVGANMAENICRYYLKLPRETTDFVTTLVRNHMAMHDLHKMPDDELKSWLAHPYIKEMALLQHADATGRETDEPKGKGSNLDFLNQKFAEYEAIPVSQRPNAPALIMGRDLIRYGLTPGKHFMELLRVHYAAQQRGLFDESTKEEYLKNEVSNAD